jgi:Thioesterase-like superfamily
MFRLRLLRLLVLWFFSKKRALLATHELKLVAWPFVDVDVTRMMAHAYTRAMALGRYQSVFASEFRHVALANAWFPMTIAESTSLLKPIKVFERFTVTSRILCWNEHRFYMEQQFLVRGDLRARSLVEGLVFGPKGKLRPSEVFAKTGFSEASPPMSAEVELWVKSREHLRKGHREPATSPGRNARGESQG